MPEWGRKQGNRHLTEKRRTEKALVVKKFIEQILKVDKNALVVVAGDYNDYEYSKPVKTVADAGLAIIMNKLPVAERYSHIFNGRAAALDQILVSTSWAEKTEFDIVHANSEYAEHASDHDPILVRINFSK